MRRNRIHVSSGTYWSAPAQFDRRMMSQMALTAPLTDCWVASRLPLPLLARGRRESHPESLGRALHGAIGVLRDEIDKPQGNRGRRPGDLQAPARQERV